MKVELVCGFSDKTWDTEIVEIPDSTEEDDIHEAAEAQLLREEWSEESLAMLVFTHVYAVGDEIDPVDPDFMTEDIFDAKPCSYWVKLHIQNSRTHNQYDETFFVNSTSDDEDDLYQLAISAFWADPANDQDIEGEVDFYLLRTEPAN